MGYQNFTTIEEFVKQNPGCSVRDYIESVTLVADSEVDDDSNYVTLATVHAAKGLEFKVVFVVGLEDGIFPNSRAKIDDSELEEERRLMYVAVTRAKERLYLTCAKNRYMFGQSKPTLISEFFSDVDDFVKPKENVVSRPVVQSNGLTCNAKNSNLSKFEKGQKVRHRVFGEGVIILIKGENADVAFKGVGIKTLSLKFAPLEVIG